MRKLPKSPLRAEKLELTPMIDVTFLLLVFFLCTLRFKTLEGKLDASLPHDVGQATHAAEPRPALDVTIRVATPGTPRALPGGRFEHGPDRRLAYRVGPRNVADLGQLRRALARLHARSPELAVTIDPGAGVAHGEVVEVLDALLSAGYAQVRIAGARGE